MIRTQNAAAIGYSEARIGVGIAIVIDLALLLIGHLNDRSFPFSVSDILKGVLAAALFFAIGQWLGRAAAIAIIVREWPYQILGPACALLTLAATAFVSGFFAEVKLTNLSEFNLKHIENATMLTFVVMIYSVIPVTVHGLWFGRRIYKRGLKLSQN